MVELPTQHHQGRVWALGAAVRLAPIGRRAKRGGGCEEVRRCGPETACAGAKSGHNDGPWRGLKPSIPYPVDFHTTAFAAV